jgi:hypothetical protein
MCLYKGHSRIFLVVIGSLCMIYWYLGYVQQNLNSIKFAKSSTKRSLLCSAELLVLWTSSWLRAQTMPAGSEEFDKGAAHLAQSRWRRRGGGGVRRGAQIAVVAGRRGVRWRAPAAARRRGSATMRKGKSYAGPVVCLRGGRGSSGGVRARVASVHGSSREMVGWGEDFACFSLNEPLRNLVVAILVNMWNSMFLSPQIQKILALHFVKRLSLDPWIQLCGFGEARSQDSTEHAL